MPKFSGRSDVLTVDKDPRPAWIDLGLEISGLLCHNRDAGHRYQQCRITRKMSDLHFD